MCNPDAPAVTLLPPPEKTHIDLDTRLAILTNLIPPYHKPLLDRLGASYPQMRVLLSVPMESNRRWKLAWQGLDVVVQKTITLNKHWRHPKGFSEPLYVHLPVDTIGQLRRFQADVVISWEMGSRTLLAAVYRQLHRRTRLIIWAEIAESTEHGRGFLRSVLRKILHHGADAFLVTGESGVRYLRSLGVPQAKIFKIAYTTDISPFAAVALARHHHPARRFLYVGQFIERKGLLPFLDALSRWATLHPASKLEFTLAGDGPLREDLQSFPVPPNLRLTLLGNVDYENLPAVYAQADTFVLPTFADTWGVVVNEAMAAGLTVLGSEYGQAVSELVREGESGWIFRPDVGDEMFDALGRSLSVSAQQLERMRSCARETALRLTPDYVTELVDAAILSCLESRRVKATAAR